MVDRRFFASSRVRMSVLSHDRRYREDVSQFLNRYPHKGNYQAAVYHSMRGTTPPHANGAKESFRGTEEIRLPVLGQYNGLIYLPRKCSIFQTRPFTYSQHVRNVHIPYVPNHVDVLDKATHISSCTYMS